MIDDVKNEGSVVCSEYPWQTDPDDMGFVGTEGVNEKEADDELNMSNGN